MKKLLFFASAAALFASCSTDMTEDLAVATPVVEGNSTVIVSFDDGGVSTRTHLGDNGTNTKPYIWDEGDAIGVFVNKDADATNAPFKYAGEDKDSKVAFKGALEFFEDGKYIVYYPYTPADYKDGSAPVVQTGGKIRMNIPATQFYNFEAAEESKGTERSGSFAQFTAPAIGIGVVEDDKLTVTLKGAASYIFFPIKGTGFVKTLKLSIGGVEHLNGYTQVLADIEDPEFGFAAPASNGSAETTLNCGVKGVELNPETATNFWFVVPNLKLEDAKITLTVNGNEDLTIVRESYTNGDGFKPNANYAIKDLDEASKPNKAWYIDVPAEETEEYVIDSEEKFLQYVYAATVNGAFAKAPNDMKTGNNELKTGKITVAELDFTNFEFEAIGSEYRKAVADWYNNAENGIPTIGGAKAFSLVGAVKPEAAPAAEETAGEAEEETPATVAPATIKGLKVNGALFNDGKATAGSATWKNKVENIILSGVETAGDYILANRVYNTSGEISFKNITVDSCTAPEGAALIGRAFTNYLEFDIVNNTDYIFANELNIMSDYDLTKDLPEGVDYNKVCVNGSTSTNPADGKIITVADKDAAVKLLGQVITKEDSNFQFQCKWYSIVDAEGTFYYTGAAATAPRSDKYITPEEFVYYTTNGGEYALTNDIDMMGETVKATAATAAVTVAEDVENVTISNVKVESAYLLAETGTAKNVNVKDATYTAEGYVGGLFFEADVTEAGKTTACVVTAEVVAAEKFGTYYAKVNLTLGTENTLTLSADFVGENAPYGAIVCKAPMGGLKGTYTNVYFEPGYSAAQLQAIADRIEWEWTTDAQIPDGYYLQLISGNTTITSEEFEFKVTNDDALAHAIENAKEGDTVKVEPGTYTTLPKPAEEGVIIDATGATFDGVVAQGNNIDLNGCELIGATFTGKQFANGANAGTINGTFTKCKFIGGETADDDGIYGYSASADVVFNECEFTAGDTAAQVLAKDGTVTYKNCTFNGFVSASGDEGTIFDTCVFNPGAAGFAGGNFWAKTTVKNTTFNFVQYDPEKSATDANYYNWISLVKHDDVETYNFTGCKVLNSEGAVVAMPANYVFQIAEKNAGTVVNIDGVQITLKATVKTGAGK